MKDKTKTELNKWPEIPVKIVLSSYYYTNMTLMSSAVSMSQHFDSLNHRVYPK